MRSPSDRLADDGDGVRASDAERDQAIGELRDQFAEGRLSQETFLYRMDAALQAKDRSDLSALFTDLPGSKQRQERGIGRRISDSLALLRRAAASRRGPGRRPGSWSAHEPPPLWLPPRADRKFTIGREMACDFTLPDRSVSRWHARLYRVDDGWLLSDLGSTNGTRLNGWRVTTGVPVQPGDQVTFGSVTFVIADRTVGSD